MMTMVCVVRMVVVLFYGSRNVVMMRHGGVCQHKAKELRFSLVYLVLISNQRLTELFCHSHHGIF